MRYDYRCKKCEQVYEVSKPIDCAEREESCPKCGSVMQRVYNPLGHSWGKQWDFDNEGFGDTLIPRHHHGGIS